MTLRGIVFQVLLLGALILAAAVATEPNSSCNRTCGSLSIPYPFGTSEDCYLDPDFLITCNHTFNPPKPFLGTGNIEVLNISVDGELRILNSVEQMHIRDPRMYIASFGVFPLSNTKNKLFVVGCNTVGYIVGTTTKKDFKIGCGSYCDSIDNVVNGSCDGVGCCQSSIPENIDYFRVDLHTLNDSDAPSFSTSSFALVTEKESYTFSSLDFVKFREKKYISDIPLVVDWTVGRISCQEAQKNQTKYACKAANSKCHDYTLGVGYRCRCNNGYDGNPYLDGGCKDIDECKISNPCHGGKQCKNQIGNFTCLCPKGYKEYKGGNEAVCNQSNSRSFAIVLGLISTILGLLVLLIGGWLFYKILKKRSKIKQKKKFFKSLLL